MGAENPTRLFVSMITSTIPFASFVFSKRTDPVQFSCSDEGKNGNAIDVSERTVLSITLDTVNAQILKTHKLILGL